MSDKLNSKFMDDFYEMLKNEDKPDIDLLNGCFDTYINESVGSFGFDPELLEPRIIGSSVVLTAGQGSPFNPSTDVIQLATKFRGKVNAGRDGFIFPDTQSANSFMDALEDFGAQPLVKPESEFDINNIDVRFVMDGGVEHPFLMDKDGAVLKPSQKLVELASQLGGIWMDREPSLGVSGFKFKSRESARQFIVEALKMAGVPVNESTEPVDNFKSSNESGLNAPGLNNERDSILVGIQHNLWNQRFKLQQMVKEYQDAGKEVPQEWLSFLGQLDSILK